MMIYDTIKNERMIKAAFVDHCFTTYKNGNCNKISAMCDIIIDIDINIITHLINAPINNNLLTL